MRAPLARAKAPRVPATVRSRPQAGLLIFAIANAGGVIGFLPLLTLLLPLKIAEIAPDERIGLVTLTTILGAVAASASNILFGWWSDRARDRGVGRRRFMAGALAATIATYALIAAADTPLTIVGAVVLFQVAVNALLGPFQATLAEEVSDGRKGAAGGLLALANPLASAVSAAVVAFAGFGEGSRLAIIAAAMTLCTLPLLLTRAAAPTDAAPLPVALARHDLLAAWWARLLVQIAGAVLFYYLLFYFGSVVGDAPTSALAAQVGQVLTLAYVVPLPIAVLCGRWSDRIGRRKPFLLTAALVAAIGLAAMAVATDWTGAALAFGLYAIGSSIFLSLHATFAMQLLPNPHHRGRDLGLINLTNTLPALLGPLLAWGLATPSDFSVLMAALAVLTALGGLAILSVRGRP